MITSRETALRRVLARMLWRAVADQEDCVCEGGEREPTDLCAAWRALGYGQHFHWRRAQKRLPVACELIA